MRTGEIIVDSFAGGGGASLGISLALGRGPDVAINHDDAAIAMHAANHPGTRHFTEDVFKAAPRKVTRGRPVGLLWASPDCRHHSRAKGSKPVEKRIRGLAWAVVKWAVEAPPRVIILENVREFEDWGPLVPRLECQNCDWKGTEGQATLARRGRRACPRCESKRLKEAICTKTGKTLMVPDPARKGLTFRKFTGRLRNLGYEVRHRVLNAADYGAPTHRRRLFLVARNDGDPIIWPEPTHGDPKKVASPSLFAQVKPWRTAAECIDWSIACPSIFERKKPLADKTLRRIAMGIKRYVLDTPKPFLVTINHGGDHFRGRELSDPMPTLTGSRGDAVVSPILARLGQTKGNGKYTNSVDDPVTTITSKAEHLLVAPTLVRHFGKSTAADIKKPLGTVTAGGHGKSVLVAAFLAKHFGDRGQRPGIPMTEPVATVTASDHHSLVAANLIHLNHGEKQWSGMGDPMRTVTTGNHAALVYSFLIRYFGTAIGQHVTEPLFTITGKDRFGLVTVAIDGELWALVDIGMRMLKPRELARAQGFPDSYLLTGSATNQVERIGNSVSPPVAAALAAANYSPLAAEVFA